jgi:hypothetical protein
MSAPNTLVEKVQQAETRATSFLVHDHLRLSQQVDVEWASRDDNHAESIVDIIERIPKDIIVTHFDKATEHLSETGRRILKPCIARLYRDDNRDKRIRFLRNRGRNLRHLIFKTLIRCMDEHIRQLDERLSKHLAE